MDRVRMMGAVGSNHEHKYGTFGGIMFNPRKLIYNNGDFAIADNISAGTYNNSLVMGLTNGSTYFTPIQVGQRFDSRGSSFTVDSGDINNGNPISFDGYDDWRIPTANELRYLTGTESGYSRPGATVNGTNNAHFTYIRVGSSNKCVMVYLFFPDNKVITGASFTDPSNFDKKANNGTLTANEFEEYLLQGCMYMSSWTSTAYLSRPYYSYVTGEYDSSQSTGLEWSSYGYIPSVNIKGNYFYGLYNDEGIPSIGLGLYYKKYYVYFLCRG